jgi:hypothetical protein
MTNLDCELTLEEHETLRKHPKEVYTALYLYKPDTSGNYYKFYIYPTYIKLIGKSNAVKLYHLYYSSTLGKDMQWALFQAIGLWVLQRDIIKPNSLHNNHWI